MNILKTFEIFLREPFTVLKRGIVQIVNLQTSSKEKCGLSVDMLDRKTQITVFNNDKMYTLLRTALYKEQNKESKNIDIQSSSRHSGYKGAAFGQLLQHR